MTDITYRSVKGTPLTSDEIDANFSNLNSFKLEKNASGNLVDYLRSAFWAAHYYNVPGTLSGNFSTRSRIVPVACGFFGDATPVTGAIVFKAPVATFSTMIATHIEAFLYHGSGATVWGKLDVSLQFYTDASGNVNNVAITQNGSTNVPVKISAGFETATNKVVLVLGDAGTVWSYPTVTMFNTTFSFSGVTDQYATGWLSSLVTNLGPFTISELVDDLATGRLARVPAATMQGYTTDRGLIVVPDQGVMQFDGTNRYITVQPLHGQCRFGFNSTTQCSLTMAGAGNSLVINGRIYKIPPAGVILSNSGLAANSLYYVYAKDNGSGAIALETQLKTGAGPFHATASNGVEIKYGDPTRTLVGFIGTNASSNFVFINGDFRVTSFFNRRLSAISENPSVSYATTAPTPMGVGLYCLSWPDDLMVDSYDGSLSTNTSSIGMYTAIYRSVDGGAFTALSQSIGITSAASGFYDAVANTTRYGGVEALVITKLYGYNNNANFTTTFILHHEKQVWY